MRTIGSDNWVVQNLENALEVWNGKLCGNAYCEKYTDYIYVNELGERIKPNYITQHFPAVLEKNGMRRIRYHDLRHPYVKYATTLFCDIL